MTIFPIVSNITCFKWKRGSWLSASTAPAKLTLMLCRLESNRGVGEICMRMFNHCMALSDDKSQPSCCSLPMHNFIVLQHGSCRSDYKIQIQEKATTMWHVKFLWNWRDAIVCQHKVLRVLRCIIHTCLMLSYRSFHHYFLPSCQRQQLHHLLVSATSCIPGFCSGFILLQHLSHVQPHFA